MVKTFAKVGEVDLKKLMNDPNRVVDEMLEGYAAANHRLVKLLDSNRRSLVRSDAGKPGKVGIVIGGGSGHEPAFYGYVGYGMADGAAVGNVFASPPPDPVVEATKAVNGGAGVVYLIANYAGDCMNFEMAAELASMEGIEVRSVIMNDDVASAPPEESDRRRGIAGAFLVYKAAGAAAEQGYSLDDTVRLANKANANTRTMGVALSPCSMPQTGKESFQLGEDEMEIGLGIHGEPGVERTTLQTADAVTANLVDRLLADMPLAAGDRVAVLVNGLGSTTMMELYIVFRKAAALLEERGIAIHRSYVGEYVTSLEMGGCSISFMKLDDELAACIDAPAETPAFTQR